MKNTNGVYIPADKVGTVLEALYFYRQIIAFGRQAENRSRNGDRYREVCRAIGYIAKYAPS